MISRLIGYLLPFLLFPAVLFAQSDSDVRVSDAVVEIHTHNIGGNGEISTFSGTGFFIAPNVVLTAYHVIAGADRIEIFTRDNQLLYKFKRISINEQYDLAAIEVEGTFEHTLDIDASGALPSEVAIYGHPYGNTGMKFKGNIVSSDFLSARALLFRGNRVFQNTSHDLIGMDITTLEGLSGAPVLSPQGLVVGILSASFFEGRSVTWGVPAKYVRNLRPLSSSDPRQITWPAYDTYFRDGFQRSELKLSSTNPELLAIQAEAILLRLESPLTLAPMQLELREIFADGTTNWAKNCTNGAAYLDSFYTSGDNPANVDINHLNDQLIDLAKKIPTALEKYIEQVLVSSRSMAGEMRDAVHDIDEFILSDPRFSTEDKLAYLDQRETIIPSLSILGFQAPPQDARIGTFDFWQLLFEDYSSLEGGIAIELELTSSERALRSHSNAISDIVEDGITQDELAELESHCLKVMFYPFHRSAMTIGFDGAYQGATSFLDLAEKFIKRQ